MTNTKLEIIGPYTPEHPGPFCTRDGKPVDLKIRDGRGELPLSGYVREEESLTHWPKNGYYDDTGMSNTQYDLMNARKVPVAREFWINEYNDGMRFGTPQPSLERAAMNQRFDGYIRTIHVREVLPGDE